MPFSKLHCIRKCENTATVIDLQATLFRHSTKSVCWDYSASVDVHVNTMLYFNSVYHTLLPCEVEDELVEAAREELLVPRALQAGRLVHLEHGVRVHGRVDVIKRPLVRRDLQASVTPMSNKPINQSYSRHQVSVFTHVMSCSNKGHTWTMYSNFK